MPVPNKIKDSSPYRNFEATFHFTGQRQGIAELLLSAVVDQHPASAKLLAKKQFRGCADPQLDPITYERPTAVTELSM